MGSRRAGAARMAGAGRETLGILGYGRIGQAVARRARAFDMAVCAIRRDVTRSADAELAFLGGLEMVDEVLRRSDYVVITLPLTAATRWLIGERELAVMKPTAVLVNVPRGEIIDEDALYTALAKRRIATAAGIGTPLAPAPRCRRGAPSTS